MSKIDQAQKYLQEQKADGWLLYDFHKSNELAHTFLEIPHGTMTTRRFFYWIPAKGTPIKLVHAIESRVLDAWPGEKRIYSSWQSLESELKQIVHGRKRIAMEYSPRNAIPYVSKVDGGTIDLIRSFGAEVISSADFLPHFTAVFTETQGQSLIRAGQALDRIVADAWHWISSHLKSGKSLTEYEVQQKILADFSASDLFANSPPIVAVNEHTADPHYEPQRIGSSQIKQGDWVLLDMWGKEKHPGSIYADITRVGVADTSPSVKQMEIFHIVREAQVAATELVKNRFSERKKVMGWEVDDAARSVIEEAGYGKFFIHRTGHNIETEVHGSGAHMDNLEMHDERPILPGTAFSIEPGIYLPSFFGIRLEYDIYVHTNGKVEIVGGEQDSIMTVD
ncbi:MAG: M24 family metallopeptidase [Verrucomicrobia bacterium]|nr:M24 family metallopeptidase [Verrucomicrobiota bacterium]